MARRYSRLTAPADVGRYKHGGQAKVRGRQCLRWPSTFEDFMVTLSATTKLATKNMNRVLHVFAMSDVLKIRASVVTFIAVFMVYLVGFRNWPQKGFTYEPVNPTAPNGSITIAQMDPQITSIVERIRLEYPSTQSSSLLPNATKVGYRIPSNKAYYWTPDFSKIVSRHDGLLTRPSCLGSACGNNRTSDSHYLKRQR